MTSKGDCYIAYVRVSSYEQAERNLSVPSQIDQIQNYAKQSWILISKIYKDEGHSAYKGNRPAFNQMLKDVKHNKNWRGLVVFKFDRLSRNLEDFIKLETLLKNNNMDLASVTEPMLNNYLGKYMVRDMQNRAILYSEELSFRVKLGFRKKMQMGGYIWGKVPYGFKHVNWYAIPDDEKAEIISFVFENYATGYFGFKALAGLVKKTFNIKNFTHARVEHIINSSMYCWYKTKEWSLSNSEYVFWGYDKPWKYTEIYQMKYITPLITKELYDKCQIIREKNNVCKVEKSGTAKFPKIFQCVCGRNLKRDDKKGHRYFGCTKQMNNVFSVKCTQGYTNFDVLEPQFKKLLSRILLTSKIRAKIIKETETRMSASEWQRNEQLLCKLKEYEQVQSKILEITNSYTAWRIGQETFELTLKGVGAKVANLKTDISLLQDTKQTTEAGQKVIRFMDILESYEQKLNSKDKNEKSSQLFPILFKGVANLIIDHRKVRSYQLFKPFDILEKCDNSQWRKMGDSNPRTALAVTPFPTVRVKPLCQPSLNTCIHISQHLFIFFYFLFELFVFL